MFNRQWNSNINPVSDESRYFGFGTFGMVPATTTRSHPASYHSRFFQFSLFLLIAVIMLAAPLSARAQPGNGQRLHIYTENYPPYNASVSGKTFAHTADGIKGICTDMVKAMLKNLNYDVSMKMRDWSYAYDWVRRHKNHALFCTARTEAREDDFQWVGPLAPIKWTFFAAPDSDITLDSLEDARQYKIAGYKGDVMTDFLISEGFDVSTGVTDELNPRKLVLGQADLWVTDGVVGPLVAEEAGITDLKPLLVFKETPLYLAVSNATDKSIVDNLQASLDKVRKAGVLDAIFARYGL